MILLSWFVFVSVFGGFGFFLFLPCALLVVLSVDVLILVCSKLNKIDFFPPLLQSVLIFSLALSRSLFNQERQKKMSVSESGGLQRGIHR